MSCSHHIIGAPFWESRFQSSYSYDEPSQWNTIKGNSLQFCSGAGGVRYSDDPASTCVLRITYMGIEMLEN